MLPFVFWELYQHKSARMLPLADKSEARLAFEEAVSAVFGFRVCHPGSNWIDIHAVVIGTTGLRKPYNDMSPEERVSSGSVLLSDLIKALARGGGGEQEAIDGALVAARGLVKAAEDLEAACDAYEMATEPNAAHANV